MIGQRHGFPWLPTGGARVPPEGPQARAPRRGGARRTDSDPLPDLGGDLDGLGGKAVGARNTVWGAHDQRVDGSRGRGAAQPEEAEDALEDGLVRAVGREKRSVNNSRRRWQG